MLSRLKTALWALLRRTRGERELDEELRYHIERQTEQNIRLGMSPEEARRAARKAFGGVEQAKERSRDARGVRWLEDLWQDLRYGARMLVKAPNITLTAVITLALGIGANTAIFSVVNAVLLRPLPFKEPAALFTVWERNPQVGVEQNAVAPGAFLDWREQNHVFEHLAVFETRGFALTGEPEAERVTGASVSTNLFRTLGVSPLLGRDFVMEEETTGHNRVAILGHSLWQGRFHADPSVIGREITLNGNPFTVIGVMPPKLRFPGFTGIELGRLARVNQPADLWVPMLLDGPVRSIYNQHNWQVIGRLKTGVTPAQATSELDAIQRLIEA